MTEGKRDWKQFVLLNIDVQRDFWPERLAQSFPDFPSQTAQLLELCRNEGIEVVHLRAGFRPDKSDWMVRYKLRGHIPCVQGMPGYETLPFALEAPGEVVIVKLTIIAPSDLHYLVVEDPLPAGCEALDVSLKTTSAAYQGPQLTREDSRPPYWWYFAESELRDEKVVLFATYLGKGTYEYTYLMRTNVAGRFLTMPTQAYEMYFPEVFGRSDGGVFTVLE